MKMELRIEGKVIVIEAEGAVSVQIIEEKSAVLPAVCVQTTSVVPVNAPAAPVPVAVPVVDAPVFVPAPAVPVAPAVVVSETAPQNAVNGESLFTKLAELRRELATAAKVPPYVVFNDKTLREMSEKLPADLAAFGNISGVGGAKLEKYGDLFLSVINEGAAA